MSKAAQKRIEDAIELYGLQAYATPDEKDWHGTLGVDVPGYGEAVAAILAAANVPESVQQMLLTGPASTGKADCEFGPDSRGLQTMSQGYGVHYAIKFARSWAAGERRIEIGMKYPIFDLGKFIGRFKVRLVREVAPPRAHVLAVRRQGREHLYVRPRSDRKRRVRWGCDGEFQGSSKTPAVLVQLAKALH